jgi:hypothetical protein
MIPVTPEEDEARARAAAIIPVTPEEDGDRARAAAAIMRSAGFPELADRYVAEPAARDSILKDDALLRGLAEKLGEENVEWLVDMERRFVPPRERLC